MPEYDVDPALEQRLERELRVFTDEAVGDYDPMETTHLAIRGVPPAPQPRRAVPGWLKAALLAVVLFVSLVAIGLAGGFIRL